MPSGDTTCPVYGHIYVSITHHPLTGYEAHIASVTSWGHKEQVTKFLRADHVHSDAYDFLSEEVGMWCAAIRDDISYRLPI